MCIKNDLVSKCWRGRAGDYFDVRESSKFMNVMHTDKRHTLAHRKWMHNVRICDALLRARCEMCFCIHLVCVCVCALSPIQHLSIRPFVRCECIFGSARWFSVYEFYLKMVMINDYLFLSIMELWFRHVHHYAHSELAVWRTHVAYVTRRLHHGHADIYCTFGTISFRYKFRVRLDISDCNARQRIIRNRSTSEQQPLSAPTNQEYFGLMD